MTAQKRGVVIWICAIFALFNGLGALMAAWVGLRGRGSSTDQLLAWFNVGSAFVTLTSFVGVVLVKKWSVWVWAASTALFFIGHGMIAYHHGASILSSPLRLVALNVLPLASLACWYVLYLEGRRGRLD